MTCSTCSRCTLRICAIATPTRWTSLGPMWRNTCAASVEPSDSSRIAALSTRVSFWLTAALLLIGVNPLFDDLCHTARIFGYQTLDGVQLCVITFARARQQDALRTAQADAVVGQFAIQAAHAAEFDVAAETGQLLALAAIGDVVEHRTQHTEYQYQDEQYAQYLLDHIPEPGLRVERDIGDHFPALGGERYVDHADAVAATGLETDGVLDQAGEARQFVGAPRRTGGLAIGRVDLDLVVDHHRHRQTGHATLLLLGVADGAIQFEVLGRLLTLVRRIRRQHRLARGRVHDLLAVGIEQRLARGDGTGRSRGAAGGLRRGGRAWRLVAQGPRYALRTAAGGTLFTGRLFAAQRRLVGIELFGGRLDRTEVHVGGDFSLVAIVAQHRLQDVVHPLGKHAFHTPAVIELLAGHAQFGVLRLVGEQVALLVDDGDLRLAELRNAGGHQVDNGNHLPWLQGTTGIQFDQYRSAWFTLIAHKHRAFRDRQVHAGGLDVVQAGNGPCQFAFEAATITGRFHELAGPQALVLVEDFKTDVAVARRHAGSGQLEAGAGHVIGLDQQRTGVRLDGVGNIRRRQGFHDLLGIHTRQAAIQRPVVRMLGPQHHGKADRHAGRQADHQANLTEHGHFGKIFQKGQPEQRRFTVCGAGLGRYVIGENFCHDYLRP